MKKDFDIQMARRKAWRGKCPYDEEELRRRVSQVQTTVDPVGVAMHPVRHHHWLWAPAVAAVACLLLLPIGLRSPSGKDIERVDIGGHRFYYVCNCGCSATGTLVLLNSIR